MDTALAELRTPLDEPQQLQNDKSPGSFDLTLSDQKRDTEELADEIEDEDEQEDEKERENID